MTKKKKGPLPFKQFKKDDQIWNFISLRNYFGKGNGDLAFIRYTFLMLGVSDSAITQDATFAMCLAVIYGLLAFAYGLIWDYKRLNKKENEWSNQRRDWLGFRKGLGLKK